MTSRVDGDQRVLSERGFYMPAEWSPHAATWLIWPESDDFPGKLEAVRWVYCELIRLLTVHERVRLIVSSGAVEERCRVQLGRVGLDLSQVDFVHAATNRTWARDNLPSFLKHRSDSQRLGAAKFRFNGWARYDDHALDDTAGRLVAERFADVADYPVVEAGSGPAPMVLEGGAIDVDGEGTLLTTRACLLGTRFARNPGASQQAIEETLQGALGVKKFVWLDDGVAGDDTSGHVDDFARFVRPGVVVCASESDSTDVNYAPLQRAQEQLRGATDACGRRLDVIALPMPGPVVCDGERLPASYANFYIANGIVLVPVFNDPCDAEALGILQELFPTRRVVGVFCRDLVLGLGTIHCSTQQEPARD